MKVRNTVISVVLCLGVIALSIWLYNCIMRPVKFENEYNKRSDEVVAKLKDIRVIQETYRMAKGEFCNNFDTMMVFLKEGKVPMVQKFGTVPDDMTEAEALKQGILRRDTTYVEPLEKLYGENKMITPKEKIETLRYIPYSENGKAEFTMQAKKINKSGVEVSVFLVEAPIETYTFGMDRQDVINRKAEIEAKNKYAGWKVGDLEQPITDGNWE